MYRNKMDIKKLACFENTNLEHLQVMISRQYKATAIKIVWHFNRDRQIGNTTEFRNQLICIESIFETK